MKDKSNRMWKEAVVAYFTVLLCYVHGGTGETTKILIQNNLCPALKYK